MLNIPEIFGFLMNSSKIFSILRGFWPNSDLNSSFGSIPRRSNLSTQVADIKAMTDEDIAEVFRVLDIDHSGTIDFDEFVNGIKEHKAALFASGLLVTVPTASQSFPNIS